MSDGIRRQVFQSLSPKRWKSFIWSFRLLLFFIIASITIVSLDLYFIPEFMDKKSIYKSVLDPDAPITFENKHNNSYTEDRKQFNTQNLNAFNCSNCGQNPGIMKSQAYLSRDIRAAYYVNWDPSAKATLDNNHEHINMLLPEWVFLNKDGQVVNEPDEEVQNFLKEKDIAVVPVLSNYHDKRWNSEALHQVLQTHQSRRTFIKNLISVIEKNGYDGLVVNLFNIKPESIENLKSFHQELYFALHLRGYIVGQNIEPGYVPNGITNASDNNDLLFVMAYGHYKPASIDRLEKDHWLENTLSNLKKEVTPEKLVLTLPANGYRYHNKVPQQMDYRDIIKTARDNKANIRFDYNHYIQYFTYSENNKRYKVFFSDATSNYHSMRLADQMDLKGFALYRLGPEDKRIWNFYNKEMKNLTLSMKDMVFNVLEIQNEQENKEDYTLDTDEEDKRLVLTFDDGPDSRYTPEILAILQKYNIPASFFVTGIKVESDIPLFREIYESGYEIGNHTFTHPNLLEVGEDRAELEVRATTRLIECITGRSTRLFRPPYSADEFMFTDNEILPVSFGKGNKYYRIADPVNPRDWKKDATADTIYNKTISQVKAGKGRVILLHDGGGDRTETIKALPRIIETLREEGYRFTTIADLMGVEENFLMPSLESDQDLYLSYGNNVLAHSFYYAQRTLFIVFFLGIILATARMVFIAAIAYVQVRKSKKKKGAAWKNPPLVSILVPAHNEEVNAVNTVTKLVNQDWPNLEVIFVDDGSEDSTYENVKNAFKDNPKVKVFNKPNGGKATALNKGIAVSKGDFLVCIDADTQLKEDAVSHLMESFTDEKTGAVAGNVKVGNEVNTITKWQSIEYITSQNFDKRAFSVLNGITVVPGAIGAFRREAVLKAGRYSTDTLAEDCDLTMRVLRAGYKVEYNSKAIARTEVPETISQFLKQRFRWTFGIFQSWWKHKDTLFNPKYKGLGMAAMPNTLIFQILLPMLVPVADIIMVYALLWGDASKVASYYFMFLGVELAGAIVAFSFEKENILRLWLLLPQRLVYRFFMWYVLTKAILRAIKGELMTWGILKRTGNVKA